MFDFDYITKEDIKEQWPRIIDHPYRILIIEGSGSGKTKHYLTHYIMTHILIRNLYMLKIHMKQKTN